jgi:multidrug efflux pump subunit AcrA (membrane-fusion protein)
MGRQSLKISSLLLVLSGFTPVVLPASAQERSAPSAVIRIPECQILLADERLLASGQSGIVSTVNVREGDRVKKGQLLAELDSSVPKATLAVAMKQAENDVNVRFAIAAAKVAQAELDSALDANDRQPNTFPRINLRKLRLEEVRSILETEVSRHEFELNRLRRDEAAALVDSYKIVAPMDGIISRVFKFHGEAVQVGEALLQCQSTDKVHVEAHVDIGLLAKGRSVRVVPSRPNPAIKDDTTASEGTVFFVGVLADLTTETVRVLVEVDNRNGLLVAGTDAVIEIPPVLTSTPSTGARRE